VLSQNIVHGDAFTMLTKNGQPITFAEWGYLGKGRFLNRPGNPGGSIPWK
jgi:hypothetical protein